MTQVKEDVPVRESGIALVGKIRDKDILLSWKLSATDIEAVELVIDRIGRDPDRIPLTARGAVDEAVTETITFDGETNVSAMSIRVLEGNEWRKLPHDPKNYFLDRLLSLDINQLNNNLRWATRVEDLDTRFFAARNSIAHTPGNIELHSRALVAVSYQAIESDREPILDWAHAFCLENSAAFEAEPDLEVLGSTLAFRLHLAVWRSDVESFEQIARALFDKKFEDGVKASPRAIFNLIRASVLAGGYYYNIGNLTAAADICGRYDHYFRVVAEDFPRALFREIVTITKAAYVCRIIFELAQKRHPEKGAATYLKPTPNNIWMEGNRLWDPAARERMQKKFAAMIEAAKAKRRSS
ncbi:hypothetical protein [Methylobacterium sp. Leaf118]|uniref:hypothetical protein n=1 Tax=Methylobacterium sp. Leaf118 TaxID=2876562 RepID=UPI001E3ABE60|nr:hypothetical protein [Methylobacterium sp. Leaf118]